MFSDIVHMQNLNLMPISSVAACGADDANGNPTAAGTAHSNWPGVEIKNCGNAVSNVTWTRGMTDGSITKGMESAASYSGSTNPGGVYKYGVDMDFMGCNVQNVAGSSIEARNSGEHWVAQGDARCTATG